MTIVDSNYDFRYIDVRSVANEGDSNILKATKLDKQIYQQTLNLPQPEPLPNNPSGQPMPYVFLADEAFAMCKSIMRPYPAKKLTWQQRVYNYWLSRARRYVECGFGILANKWRILHGPIDVSIDVADIIIQACCVLHNFVRHRDGYNFEDTLSCPLESIPAIGKRDNIGVETRNSFKNYFCSPAGSVSRQNRSCNIVV
ncbi:hypothetical protein AVEN_227345-1 [Araneus ventricosus]|uniref:DDE Tnp4 domain-containing protein n=1 Tax=Araneus ventricosus TaxID=182803 RepID=A0A4Y2GWD9_ARAVE|nr:hypothetical protein AVEN_227345-1 [Araneus ventricosus]